MKLNIDFAKKEDSSLFEQSLDLFNKQIIKIDQMNITEEQKENLKDLEINILKTKKNLEIINTEQRTLSFKSHYNYVDRLNLYSSLDINTLCISKIKQIYVDLSLINRIFLYNMKIIDLFAPSLFIENKTKAVIEILSSIENEFYLIKDDSILSEPFKRSFMEVFISINSIYCVIVNNEKLFFDIFLNGKNYNLILNK